MRIKELTMSEDGFRIVTEADNGRLRETLMGYDEDGVAFIRWGDVAPEQELETFSPVDMPPIIRCGEVEPEQETPCVEWFNVPLTEAVTWQLSGKWEIQMRDSPLDEWVPFSNEGPVYDAMQFRARPKPEALS